MIALESLVAAILAAGLGQRAGHLFSKIRLLCFMEHSFVLAVPRVFSFSPKYVPWVRLCRLLLCGANGGSSFI
jgi:hypothetical protein